MLLLAALPVAVTIVIRVAGGRPGVPGILDTLMIRTVMPLVALVFGTAALGSELEDGTAVYLVTKPIARARIIAAKLAVAGGLTLAMVVPVTMAVALIRTGLTAESYSAAVAYGVAVAVGGVAYTTVFLALGTWTGRALVLGLVYVLVWEGVLAGLMEGVRFVSIRQATLGVAGALSGRDPGVGPLDLTTSVVVLTAAIAGGLALATWRLSRFEVRAD